MEFRSLGVESHTHLACMLFAFALTILYGFNLFRRIRPRGILQSNYCNLTYFVALDGAKEKTRHTQISPPCEQIIKEAEVTNRRNGHENLGCLSFEAGFLPQQMPLRALPRSHSRWDRVAQQMPALVKDQTLRNVIDQMPLLSAEEQYLEDRYLQRAAAVLGTLAHAYVRLDGQIPLTAKYKAHSEVIPDSLSLPWSQVCKRLRRTSTLLTYTDLILQNYTTSADTAENITLENFELLIPSTNNREEQVFFGTMIEMNAKAVPVMREIVEAQRSVLARDQETLQKNISQITALIRAIMKVTIAKVTTNSSKSTCMDPVVWTKTVANLAIPWLDGVIGPAGSAHPFFHMMDEFTGRSCYNTTLGAEVLRVRADYPLHWQQFLNAVRETSVANYIADTNNPKLSRLWQALNDIYSGDEGLLGLHRRKVYGFLSVSFRVGRDSTVNGLGRRQGCQQWEEADDELEIARQERSGTKLQCRTPLPASGTGSDRGLSTYAVHELIQHNNTHHGYWFSACGHVYDATSFLSSHPGGRRAIILVSGQDASSDLAAVAHLSNPGIRSTLERYRIGSLRRRNFSSPVLRDLYQATVRLGFRLAETENIYDIMVQVLECRLTGADQVGDLNALRMRLLAESGLLLRDKQKPSLELLLRDVLRHLCQINGSDIDQGHDGSERETETGFVMEDAAPTAFIERNRRNLADIKMACVRMLMRLDSLSSGASPGEGFCRPFADDLRRALWQVDQLGR